MYDFQAVYFLNVVCLFVEEDLDLEDGQWEEIHVITGALKLFLRELPEPLFPFSFFDKFIAAIREFHYNPTVLHNQFYVIHCLLKQSLNFNKDRELY